MRKRSRPASGEQLPLIDVGPEHSEEIIKCAGRLKAATAKKKKAREKEVLIEAELRELLAKEHLSKVDGKVRIKVGGYTIELTPHEDKIKVKGEDEGDDEKADDAAPAEAKPDQGKPTVKQKKRKKRTAKSMQETVADTE